MTDVVSIRPGVGMLGLFPHMKYKPWYALGELVDNSIQSHVANSDRLRQVDGGHHVPHVAITLSKDDGGVITIRDNAAGISAQDWPRAFLVAEPPSDTSGLSQFGIGMKAACCWFAREWSLRTSHLGEPVSRAVVFDVPTIVASRNERLDVHEEPEGENRHYTELRLWNLIRVPQTKTIGKMRSHLGSIYRQFVRDGAVRITFNNEPVTYDEPRILVAPRWNASGDSQGLSWQKDVDIRLESGRKVTGFVALREKGSTTEAGLALFYRRKVVNGAADEMYKPEEIFGRSNSFRSQRVFGELHMDDFNVTYTKDALVWYDEEQEFVELLKEQLDEEPLPLLKQAESHRSRVVPPPPQEVVRRVVDRARDLLAGSGDLAALASADSGSAAAASPLSYEQGLVDGQTALELPVVHADRDVEVTVAGTTWSVQLRLVAEDGMEEWVQVLRDDVDAQPKVKVTVNQAHPFMRAFCEMPGQELEPVWRVALALGLGQEVARQGGVKQAGVVTQKVNKLLRSVLSKQE